MFDAVYSLKYVWACMNGSDVVTIKKAKFKLGEVIKAPEGCGGVALLFFYPRR